MRELIAEVVEAGGEDGSRRGCPRRLRERWLATAGEGVSRVIRRPPLIGKGALTFLLWEARADSSRARERAGDRVHAVARGRPADGRVDRADRAGERRWHAEPGGSGVTRLEHLRGRAVDAHRSRCRLEALDAHVGELVADELGARSRRTARPSRVGEDRRPVNTVPSPERSTPASIAW